MLEPDATVRVPPHDGAPTSFGPDALQILTTEHWSLLAARNLVYTEAMGRTSIFVAALSGAVVALALVAQADDFGSGFVAFALVLLPVVYFLGVVTIARLAQVNRENRLWVQGMNRIRHAYLQLAPELEPYFVTSKYDDEAEILRSSLAAQRPLTRMQPFISAPGVVAVLDSVVAGVAAGIACVGSTSESSERSRSVRRSSCCRWPSSRSGRETKSAGCRPGSSRCFPPRTAPPELLSRHEAERPLGIGSRDLDRADSPDRDDEPLRLLPLASMRREGEEAEPGLGARGCEREPRPVGELDADLRLLECVISRERGDHARDAAHELIERPGGPRGPHVRRHQKSPSGSRSAPTCSRPSAVITRPRGVR